MPQSGALKAFMKPWRRRVEPFGILTTLVEPGFIRNSFPEAATRVPVSEPYQGGQASRKPIPLSRILGSQTKVVAAMIKAVLSETHRAASCSVQMPVAWSPTLSKRDWQLSSSKRPSRSRLTLTRAKSHHDHSFSGHVCVNANWRAGRNMTRRELTF
jgi:hypothetical protein